MKKVIIGISGGVDSSVAAVLLKEQGYEVIGVTFIFTDDFDTTDAIKVCEKIGIEHHIIDYRDIFKRTVIDKFINDYNKGITPNPCILCNREIKFNFLYQNMLKLDCDYIATGHYAKIIDGKLYKSEDLNKDQTYFLAQLTNEQLNRLILPLEGIDKEQVREIAKQHNLITADKKDSTDVCFINDKFKEYINNKVENKKGKVINVEDSSIIGEHNGLKCYTIGQRRGLNIGGTKEKMYVVGKNIEENILYVALGDDNKYLISTSCILSNVNLLTSEKIKNLKAKFRYRQEEIDVEVDYVSDEKLIIRYPEGVKSVTPGQACVLYNGNQCIGGGIIETVCKNDEKIWYIL
ncbi:MAG: tRNA 2-thiouridine(34) synthase MnmA [Firmicutes bacterium]|nr:tRNA 2-thiouridine(34) synthase MnmA [Bacillota bacterium]